MAVAISNAFVQMFDAEVKQAYQGARALAGVVRKRVIFTSHCNDERLHCC